LSWNNFNAAVLAASIFAGCARFEPKPIDVAESSARLQSRNVASVAWQVRANRRRALIDFVAAEQREAILAQQQAIQAQLIQLLEQRLRAGEAANSEVTILRTALNQLQLELSDARQQRVEAHVRLAEAIGISSAALQLQVAKQYPDVHLGPGYQYDQGDHKISLSLTAELPVSNQNQGPIAEAEGRRAEAAARFDALQANVLAEVDRALGACQVALTNAATLQLLRAAHESRRQMIEAQVQAGAAERLDLLNARLEFGASQLLQLSGRVRLHLSFAALEEAVQRPFPGRMERLTEAPPRSQAIRPLENQ
jgi:outer membrane protein TolC